MLVLALTGCGGSGSSGSDASSSSDANASSPAALTAGTDSTSTPSQQSSDAVATVEATPIAQATFAHWLAVTAALSGEHGKNASAANTALKNRVMGFLISSEWLLGEASARKINVSEAEIKKHLEEDQKEQFERHPPDCTTSSPTRRRRSPTCS